MKNNNHGLKTQHFPDYLQEAALDREWEENYRCKCTQLPEGRSQVSPHRWNPKGRAPMSGEAGTV